MHDWSSPDGRYQVSTDPGRLDLDMIHAFLTTSYWAVGIPRDIVERSIEHSIPFGLYSRRGDPVGGGEQVGFARVVTDRATYGYLADVFVVEAHRGRGVGIFLIGSILEHPELLGLRAWALRTKDAHTLYGRFGFEVPANPERIMFLDRKTPDIWLARGDAGSDGTSAPAT